MHNQGYIEQCIVDSFCVNHPKNNTIFESLEKDSFVLKVILKEISFFSTADMFYKRKISLTIQL